MRTDGEPLIVPRQGICPWRGASLNRLNGRQSQIIVICREPHVFWRPNDWNATETGRANSRIGGFYFEETCL